MEVVRRVCRGKQAIAARGWVAAGQSVTQSQLQLNTHTKKLQAPPVLQQALRAKKQWLGTQLTWWRFGSILHVMRQTWHSMVT